MATRIPFPATPADAQFWTDPDTGLRWQWSVFKKRWSLTPLAVLTNAFTSSESTPSNENLPWFDPSDGTLSIWSPENDAWIVTSGSGNDGEDGEDLTSTAQVVTIATATHTLVTANVDKYLRFTYAGGDTRSVTIPMSGGAFVPAVGNIITIRNASSSTNLTVLAANVSITINKFAGAEAIAPQTSAQILYLGSDNWDII